MLDRVAIFLTGIMLAEVYTFIMNMGLSEKFPLIRSIFVMTSCAVVILLIWINNRFYNVENRLATVGLNQQQHEGALRELRHMLPQISAPQTAQNPVQHVVHPPQVITINAKTVPANAD